MAESKLWNLSVEFSVKIIKLCESIKGHYSLTNQLERSGTSIGANIHEANYAHSKPDFISKLQIALKECYETEYWLELFMKSEILDKDKVKEIYNECGTIRKILISSINTAKKNSWFERKHKKKKWPLIAFKTCNQGSLLFTLCI